MIDRVGVADGSRMHTARSRNDQVMVTELLYLRERALTLAGETTGLVAALLDLAAEHVTTVMPGYTHMQPAKPTTVRPVGAGLRRRPLRALGDLRHAWDEFDASPLGAVESYGASWPIDRALTARLLGFSRVWEVPQDAIGARGLPQLAYLDVCKRLALTVEQDRRGPAALHHLGVRLRRAWRGQSPSGSTRSPAARSWRRRRTPTRWSCCAPPGTK